MKLIILCSLLSAVIAIPAELFEPLEAGGKHWALIVAGSNTWDNYRHQADICHAYQILSQHGIPDERIVVMMYDDIAHNEQNPTPGKVINKPNGPDVYHNVLKDYTGEDVTPDTFLKVLQGDSEGVKGRGSGKVIKSGPKDHVFVNFADHGAPGILAFPSDELKADDLIMAIKSMHQKKQYKQMVFYVEACESGSMFDSILPKDINVFATTAANPMESSYACYYDNERETYLGDVYSVNWMEDSDKENLKVETLQKQFEIVRKETNTSHVMEYGMMSLGKLAVSEFQGDTSSEFSNSWTPNPNIDAVPSQDVRLNILNNRYMAATEDEKQAIMEDINALLKTKTAIELTVKDIAYKAAKLSYYSADSKSITDKVINSRLPLTKLDCYFEIYQHLKSGCRTLDLPKNDYGLRNLYAFVNMCEMGFPAEHVKSSIDSIDSCHYLY
ncbi:hypothetical protein ScPMuIL_014883 [Solemya velum]